jgi:hypothetical protein
MNLWQKTDDSVSVKIEAAINGLTLSSFQYELA